MKKRLIGLVLLTSLFAFTVGCLSGSETVELYFPNTKDNSQVLSCDSVQSVERELSEEVALIPEETIRQLLLGPTESEKGSGFMSVIPEGVQLIGLQLEGSIAKIDFSAGLNQVGGSCGTTMARAQITRTLLQFSEIEEVQISVEGKTEDILEP
ncbi:MAG: GerMN domain-containing protein [bacterium]|nr:GerMN domain-containing protein [bacterium]